MDTAAMRFGAAPLGLGLLSFLVLESVWGGIGPCTDLSQFLLLILTVAGMFIGGGVLLISLPVVVLRRYKEDKAVDAGALFPKSDKK